MSGLALTLENVSVAYGHVRAVESVSFRAEPGKVLALLGPNGAGKSTLLRAACNQATKTSGRVLLGDRDISSLRPHRITRAGVALVPEGRHVIAPLTVNENLQLAGRAAHRLRPRELSERIARVYDLLAPLQRLTDRPSALLSGGEQQMVAIGRALVTRPAVLLLDEPSMGLAPVMVETIYRFIAHHGGLLDDTAIVLAEQNRAALSLADEVVVLSRGSVVHRGTARSLPETVLADAYLGVGSSDRSTEPIHLPEEVEHR